MSIDPMMMSATQFLVFHDVEKMITNQSRVYLAWQMSLQGPAGRILTLDSSGRFACDAPSYMCKPYCTILASPASVEGLFSKHHVDRLYLSLLI